MSEFAKRLVIERERLGLTPTAFGSQAGVGGGCSRSLRVRVNLRCPICCA